MLAVFFFNDPATTEIYTLSLHDALPIFHLNVIEKRLVVGMKPSRPVLQPGRNSFGDVRIRSEEHTSELQSRVELVCRLLLEKKKFKFAPPKSATTLTSSENAITATRSSP